MAIDVTEKIDIAWDRASVARFAMEPDNDPKWIAIAEAHLLTERPIGIGSQVRRIAKFFGKEIHYVLEVVEYVPERLMVMESIKSPFPIRVTYQFEDVVYGTTVSIRVQGTSESFYKLADFLLAAQVRLSLKGELKRLKAIMEP